MNLFAVFKYQLYLFQLEEYDIKRYSKLLLKKGYYKPVQPLRKKLVWTKKALVIFVLAEVIAALLFLVVFFKIGLGAAFFWLVICFLVQPFLFILAFILLLPLDFFIKKYIIQKARKILKKEKSLKIIAIAGSYGKTTLKNTLLAVLSVKLKTGATPESVNTPLGIAQWILKIAREKNDVLIIEMGEHYQGDIKRLCLLFAPDIVVLTGINEAHLERLGSIENSISALFEIVENSPKNSLILLNGDDDNIKNNYQKYSQGRNISFYGGSAINQKEFNGNGLFWQADFPEIGKVKIHCLGEYALANGLLAAIIGKALGLDNQEIKKGIYNVKPAEHRLQPISAGNNILIIDDAYNGNPDGVQEAIRVLGRFGTRRKIFITPGLVEMGGQTEKIHKEIGKSLAKIADKIILIKNSVTKFIEQGLKEANYDLSNIIWFETAQKALDGLKDILKPNDVALLQNDWGDQYV
ncbi:MAG: UDP-N-acetylmuramoyl-tripeptide--D-alanyl-D-alanine ligase [Patescibacteria group bacterium]|nr:UDP-N-acetylmuramoyl-tripeptide--D-alanyl-D-alanine ligase [Patescibacteria group bacterium]